MRKVIIAGGYGVVGTWIARHLHAAGHDLEVIIGGRHPDSGAELAEELGASVAYVDSENPASAFAEIGPVDLVISALQDPNDNLLRATLQSGAAYIGVVRKVDNLGATAMLATSLSRRPVLLMGHWQAGVTTLAALAAAQSFARIESIELAALFDRADKAGPMTMNDSGAFFSKALIRHDGQWERIEQTENIRTIVREDLPPFHAQPMGVLDVPALVAKTNADRVRFDIGMGESAGTLTGKQASHEIFIDVTGENHQHERVTHRTVVSAPLGQAHLTALGAMLGAERILGLDGAAAPAAGLHFPENTIDPHRAMSRLREFGVNIYSTSAR